MAATRNHRTSGSHAANASFNARDTYDMPVTISVGGTLRVDVLDEGAFVGALKKGDLSAQVVR